MRHLQRYRRNPDPLLQEIQNLLQRLVDREWTGQAGMELAYNDGYTELMDDAEDMLDRLKNLDNPGAGKPRSRALQRRNPIPTRYQKQGFTRTGQKKKSTRPGKKWMVLAKKGNSYKVVHGGYVGMKDYTQHRDKKRRERFWQRMGGRNSSKARDPFSPLYWHKKFGTW